MGSLTTDTSSFWFIILLSAESVVEGSIKLFIVSTDTSNLATPGILYNF